MSNVINAETGKRFALYHGDTVEVARMLPDASVGFSVFSPPFSSLYTFSDSPRDLSNCKSDAEFFAHYDFLIQETARVMKPGRNVAIHCMLLTASLVRDGYIGLKDFRGDIIRAYQRRGFIFHSEVCIWKDPVVAMQRTKALGLLYKQVKKDSTMSRMGIADYIVVMRAPGVNTDPVDHAPEDFPVDQWEKYASPVWDDINPSDTLQHRSAREHDDERHIAPLQLEVIKRCITLYSKPSDTVWSPFAGIGSEGWVALKEGRRFVGAELKESYFKQAAINLQEAENVGQKELF